MPVDLHPLYYIAILMAIGYRTNGQLNVWGSLWLSETQFLGDFAKLPKGTISFIICLSALLFVRIEQVGSHQKDFHETRNLITFRKYVEKIQVLLKSEKKNGYFTYRPMHIYDGNFTYRPVHIYDGNFTYRPVHIYDGNSTYRPMHIYDGNSFNSFFFLMFHRAFFNSIIDKHQHMHFFTFKTVLV